MTTWRTIRRVLGRREERRHQRRVSARCWCGEPTAPLSRLCDAHRYYAERWRD